MKMFLDGDGNELVSKACAVNSSSMLGYNFFHWINNESPITIDSIEYDEVLFEVKIPVLDGTTPANMDIVLKNGHGDYLFIESKFLEYLRSCSFEISESYKKPDKYYCIKNREKWPEFIANYNHGIRGQYWDGIKQEICHMIGLSNWLEHKTGIGNGINYNETGTIRFINLVFEPKKQFKSDHDKYLAYKDRYNDFQCRLIEAELVPKQLTIGFKTYSDIFHSIVSSRIPNGLEQYLRDHYMQFAEGF